MKMELSLDTPLFKGFAVNEIAAICAAGELQKIEGGELLFRQGDSGDTMYVLEQGQIELTFVDGVPPKLLRDGDVFGELALVTDQPRTATARARTRCRLRALGQAAFERLFETHPRLMARLLRNTCRYLLSSEKRLISSLRQKNTELEQTLDYLRRTREEVDYHELLANTDELTGLYNRRCLDRQLEKLVERTRNTGSGLALMLVDLDRFKEVNDKVGHSAGDDVLRAVGAIIAGCVRGTDLPCRFGGDEFAIVLTEIAPEQALARAEIIRKKVSELPPVDSGLQRPPGRRGEQLRVTASIGVAMLGSGSSGLELFDRADRELYAAKDRGRNCVVWEGRPVASSPD